MEWTPGSNRAYSVLRYAFRAYTLRAKIRTERAPATWTICSSLNCTLKREIYYSQWHMEYGANAQSLIESTPRRLVCFISLRRIYKSCWNFDENLYRTNNLFVFETHIRKEDLCTDPIVGNGVWNMEQCLESNRVDSILCFAMYAHIVALKLKRNVYFVNYSFIFDIYTGKKIYNSFSMINNRMYEHEAMSRV